MRRKWQAYLVKVEAYFEANSITEDKQKRALLIASLGTKTVAVLCGKVAPLKPNSLSYEDVVNMLNNYYDPTPNEISGSYKFFNHNQNEDEEVQAFIVPIRQIAQNCNFSSMLDRMTRDRIVCGVRSKKLQKQLLAKKDLTLKEAEALALAAESTECDAQGMMGNPIEPNVYTIAHRNQSTTRNPTFCVQKQCRYYGNSGTRPQLVA